MRTDRPPPVVSSELRDYLDRLVRRLRGRLADHIVGIYLHGSGSMDAFVPSRSDVDVLVVVDASLTDEVKALIADDLSPRSLPCRGVGLELAIVDAASLTQVADAPAFELQLDMHDGHSERVIDGTGHDGDPDLLAHYATAKAHGITVFGPPAISLFPPIDRELLIRTFVSDLAWGLEHGHAGYAVLNACRALRFAREGVLSSKPEGGAWAIEQGVGDRATIEAALRRQAGADEDVDASAAETFVGDVRRELVT
jgi:streptomycin 3"-adenylyltransferase